MKKFLLLLMALPFVFTSCGDDDDKIKYHEDSDKFLNETLDHRYYYTRNDSVFAHVATGGYDYRYYEVLSSDLVVYTKSGFEQIIYTDKLDIKYSELTNVNGEFYLVYYEIYIPEEYSDLIFMYDWTMTVLWYDPE